MTKEARIGERNSTVGVLLLTLAVAFWPGALAGQNAETGQEESQQMVDRKAPITLVVQNHNWLDMKIYAVVEGNRWRLGTVYTGQRTSITLPKHLGADFRPLELVAYPIGGGGAAVTGELFVLPGDEVDWMLENNLGLSSVFIS